MSTTQLEAIPATTGRSLVDPKLFDRLSARVAIESGTDRAKADRIMDQALAFLATCAVSTVPLSPSKTVDIGWHVFLVYTQDYSEFCQRIAGRFIHHVPTDEQDGGGDGDDTCGSQKRQADGFCNAHHPLTVPTTVSGLADSSPVWETTAAMVAAGYVVDAPMWEASGNCSQCHNGCHNDPPPDKG
jgi:hypothetical protein